MFDGCCGHPPEWSDDGEVIDDDANALSYVGHSAYEILRTKHHQHHHTLWNVSSGTVIGKLLQTPLNTFQGSVMDPPTGHSDWFPIKMAEIMGRTERWCDVMSLGPPDGLFMDKFRETLAAICLRVEGTEQKINIRMMFGNIIGMPVNCNAVIKQLTENLPVNPNICLWVGAWRKGVSWNHAKIIAVDGLYLHTGGHNMWDRHYLKNSPVHDLSLELKGRVAHDGHLFANDQWRFVEKMQSTCWGEMVNKIPDNMIVVAKSRVAVSEFPVGQAAEFPPYYRKSAMPQRDAAANEVPVISIGRYGSVLRYNRPSDDAFLAMFDSAKTVIRMALQDLGPVCVPNSKVTVPGCVWPKEYLSAFGRAIWTRGVDVEIILSNPHSIPDGLTPIEANYGNGWSCVDVAAEIIKTISKQFPEAADAELRKKVQENLRVCFLRRTGGSSTWDNGKDTLGLHAKHFIIDDICAYIGSQNLYICDLAEWGVAIDHAETVKKFMGEYWNPMWAVSYTGNDCNVDEVMDGLEIDRDGEKPMIMTTEHWKLQKQAAAMQTGTGVKNGNELYYDVDEIV